MMNNLKAPASVIKNGAEVFLICYGIEPLL